MLKRLQAWRQYVQGKACVKCGKPLPNVHRSKKREALLCYEHYLETPEGRYLLEAPYNPPIAGGSGYAGGRLIRQIHIHHTASDSGNVESIRAYHISLGWGEIAYNEVITNGNGGIDGQRQIGKPDSSYPFSVGNYLNFTAWAFVFVGNFSATKVPTPAQWQSGVQAIREKSRLYAIPRQETLGHREARANSVCPGFTDAILSRLRFDAFSNYSPITERQEDMSIQHPAASPVDDKGLKWRADWFDMATPGLEEYLIIGAASAKAPGESWGFSEINAYISILDAVTGQSRRVATYTLKPGAAAPFPTGKLRDDMKAQKFRGAIEVDFSHAYAGRVSLSNGYMMPK